MWCFIQLNCTADAFLVSTPNGIKRSVEGEKKELQSKKSYFWTEMVNLHDTEYALEFETEEDSCQADLMCEEGNAITLGSSVIGDANEMYRFRPTDDITNFYAIIKSRHHVEFSYLYESDPILKSKRAPDCYTSDSKVFEVQLFDASNVLLWVAPDSNFVLTLSASLPQECTPVIDEEEFLVFEAEVLSNTRPEDTSGSAGILLISTLVPFAVLSMCFLFYLYRKNKKSSKIAFDYPHWSADFLVWGQFDG